MFKLTIKIETETAHRLINHPGRCRFLHGHRYEWRVEVEAAGLNLDNMVVDFSAIKKIVNTTIDQYDHAVLLNLHDHLVKYLDPERVIQTQGDPTAEVIARLAFASINRDIVDYLGTQVVLTSVSVTETSENVAEYRP